MATFQINFQVPGASATSENKQRVKDLLLEALAYFKETKGDELALREYALAKILLDGCYENENVTRMLAEEAEVR